MVDEKYKKIIEAAKAGGEVLKKYFGTNLKAEEKTMPSDVFTKADKEAEQVVVDILLKHFPDYNILAEENGFDDKKCEYTFVIDPLDGTNNFVLGIPYFASAIALLKKDQTIFSVIYNPITDNAYYAEKNKGSFVDGAPLKVSAETNMSRSSVSYIPGYANYQLKYSTIVKKRLEHDQKVKRLLVNWCPTMDFCLLASGKIEAVINDETQIYDYVAGKLIAQEAGAVVTDLKGNDQKDRDNKFLISNNKIVHDKILENL